MMSQDRHSRFFAAAQALTGLLAFNLTVELLLTVLFGPLDLPPAVQFLIAAVPSVGGAAGLAWSKRPG